MFTVGSTQYLKGCSISLTVQMASLITLHYLKVRTYVRVFVFVIHCVNLVRLALYSIVTILHTSSNQFEQNLVNLCDMYV